MFLTDTGKQRKKRGRKKPVNDNSKKLKSIKKETGKNVP